MKDVRAEALASWAKSEDLGVEIPAEAELRPVSDDASFRRYFRFDVDEHKVDGRKVSGLGLVFVDAPPEHEDNESFLKISGALIDGNLNCPRVVASDLEQGFMAVTDLGNTLYLDVMNSEPSRIPSLYREAIDGIVRMMAVTCELPPYDEQRLLDEMSLFHEWFLEKQLGIELSDADRSMLQQVYLFLSQRALEQPTAFVHRDYHCRNLMVVESNSPGIIDFQDAVIGPVTYDLVSLYKDCYYRFDREVVEQSVSAFRDKLIAGEIVSADAPVLEWFDLMGAQRHLKCAGIFSRLNLRDGKPGYLKDIPLVISYLQEASDMYPALSSLSAFLREQVQPRLPL
ncbi:MAG: phosphotransferase [Pseudomonadales bacterium]|nr:phosphotransferase [Pseudomonadales bacterium]